MSTSEYPNVRSLIMSVLKSDKFSRLKEARKRFIFNVLICFLSIKGRINFLQLSRFSGHCEQYFRINFENRFNFQDFNLRLIPGRKIEECIVAFDPSYIPKRGKQTFGTGRYWSGCAKQAKWGLDICGFAVVDVLQKTAFHLNAIQTPPLEEMTLLDYYCRIVKENCPYFKEVSSCLVADAFFSKKKVVDTVLSLGLHFMSRLRDDAVLQYIYRGEPTGKKGRPKKFEGKVNPCEPDMGYFSETVSTDELNVYSAIVYSKAFEREINPAVAVFYKNGKEITRKLYFSTDLDMTAEKIACYYRSRFQIEFLYRDAKQYCGLTNCQARSEYKLNFHFNAVLTAVNLAKIEWINSKTSTDEQFSMSDYKTMYNNELILNTFIRKFGINPNTKKNKQIINELRLWGKIDA
jgi:hypothetical protein